MKRIAIILIAALLCSFKVVPVKLRNGETAYLPEALIVAKPTPIRSPFMRIPFAGSQTPRPFKEQARLSTFLSVRRSWTNQPQVIRLTNPNKPKQNTPKTK